MHSFNGPESDPSPGDTLKGKGKEWYWALERLGFSWDAHPSWKEVKCAYYCLAKKHHTDHHAEKSEEVKKMHEEIFKKVVEARDILYDYIISP
jgi:DnaJ-class molecular chaperone